MLLLNHSYILSNNTFTNRYFKLVLFSNVKQTERLQVFEEGEYVQMEDEWSEQTDKLAKERASELAKSVASDHMP